jgi:hypothetical protein
MEEAAEKVKESSHSAHANGTNGVRFSVTALYMLCVSLIGIEMFRKWISFALRGECGNNIKSLASASH